MKERSDLDLIQLVRSGNRGAWSQLTHRYVRSIYWVARRLTGTHREADAITRETFVKAYLSLGDFRSDGSFGIWLLRLAVSHSLNAIRKQQLAAYVQESELLRRLLPERASTGSHEKSHEPKSELVTALGNLPEKQRALFILRFFENLSYEEVSQVLKVSIGNLETKYLDALRTVRDLLKDRIGETSLIRDSTDEHRAAENLRSRLNETRREENDRDESYWSDLISRTDRRLDDAASGKAISISWAARVAIPGVVAIVFFFIGLHYYIPRVQPAANPLQEMLLGLSREEQDYVGDVLGSEGSLGRDPGRYSDLFTISGDEIEQYLVETGHVESTLETFSEQELRAFMDAVRSHHTTY